MGQRILTGEKKSGTRSESGSGVCESSFGRYFERRRIEMRLQFLAASVLLCLCASVVDGEVAEEWQTSSSTSASQQGLGTKRVNSTLILKMPECLIIVRAVMRLRGSQAAMEWEWPAGSDVPLWNKMGEELSRQL
jgi:hypothetical protein